QVAEAVGIGGTSASAGTVISATIPVFVVILAALRLRQPVSRLQQLGLAAAFAGIAVVASAQDGGSSAGQTMFWGVALVLVSALAVASYKVRSVELTAQYGTVAVAASRTVSGGVAPLP